MSHVFHRNNKHNYPVAVQGDGIYIIDEDGKRYLDGCCGAAVSCLGHSHPKVREAISKQVNELAFAHSGFFTTRPMENLADFLVQRAPEGLDRVYFVSGGSEAVEASIKLARQYYVEKQQSERKYVIARWQSYHGNTIGALSASGNKWRREQYRPVLVDMKHIAPCYEYRGKQAQETSFDYGQRVANELEAQILELGPEQVMAFIAEPVVGATMGCVPAVEGYFKRIRQICDQYGVLLILDEIMCGMGRTGSLFACEQEGVVPDILTIAKGLGAGYQPIGAMLASKKIYDVITDGLGFFQHGHTYIGHAVGCSAALAVQQVIEDEGLLSNVVEMGDYLQQCLKDECADHPLVGDIRGRGLFQGIEFVADKQSKDPLPSELKWNAKIKAQSLKNGLMCYPMGGTVNGKQGDHVMFAPPFTIQKSEIERLVDSFSQSLAQCSDLYAGEYAKIKAPEVV